MNIQNTYNFPAFFTALFFALALVGCKTADLRTVHILENETPMSDAEKGKSLLKEAARAHQVSYWENISTYRVIFQDQFYGIGKLGNPWNNNKNKLQADYIPGGYGGRIQRMEGRHIGDIWGYYQSRTYIKKAGKDKQIRPHKKAAFWLLTYPYFLELPALVQQAEMIRFAGTKTIRGKTYQLVFATWQSEEPNKKYDQYLLYLHPETHLIEMLEFTIRDAARFITGTMTYDDFRAKKGPVVPFRQTVKMKLDGKNILHRITIYSFEEDVVNRNELEF